LVIVGFFIVCGSPATEWPTLTEIQPLRPFAFQTFLQWLFSQGERMVLLMLRSPEQIGVYGFVSDLSPLIARIIFAPVESSVFSICGSSKTVPVDVLTVASRLVVYVGLAAAAFGQRLAPPVFASFYGAKWTSAEAIATFAAVCRVLPLMALNGVTEAVANARLADRRLELYNLLLVGVTVVYFTLMAIGNGSYGPPGAVYSNGVNMGIRCVMAISVIFGECGRLWALFPTTFVIAVFLAIAACSPIFGYFTVLSFALIVAALVLYTERAAIRTLFALFSNTKTT
jgi:hypothetical protein